MKLSQEQTEGKLPEPAAAHSQAGEQEKALDISGQLRHVRGWPPHTPRGTGGAASSGPERWELSRSPPCNPLIRAELTPVRGLIWKQLKFCAKQAVGYAARGLARTGPFHHQRRNLISAGLGQPQTSKQGGQLNPGAGHAPQSRRQTQQRSAAPGWRLLPAACAEGCAHRHCTDPSVLLLFPSPQPLTIHTYTAKLSASHGGRCWE